MFTRKPKINFLVIGVQKSGTSALDKYLRKHPEIGMPKNMKELHFFDNEKAFRKPIFYYKKYENQFSFNEVKKVYGEISPSYFYWESACNRIYRYNKNIKLIVILRNPIERAYSHWNMEVNRGNEKNDFSYCIQHEDERIKGATSEENRLYSYVSRGVYSTQIKRFESRFDKNQILYIKYENFLASQRETLQNVFLHLGVSSNNFTFDKIIDHSIKYTSTLKNEDRLLLQNKYNNEIHWIEEHLGWDCSDWV